MSLRTLAVCCDQWPVVASGCTGPAPVAVVHANRVVAADERARAEGVAVGLRRREAQSRCPSLEIVEHDPGRDARAFEAVVGALEVVAPRWEVTTAGRCAVPSRGPSRFHGGDAALAARVRQVVGEAVADLGGPPVGVGVGVADGPQAAAVVAQMAAAPTGGPGRSRGVVVAPGGTAAHLGPLPIGVIAEGGDGWGRPSELVELVGVLQRLGLHRLGRFAALEATDVLARFGPVGRAAHDFARGGERSVPVLDDVPTDLRVGTDVDPPAERVEQVAFTAKALADGLHAEMRQRGLACTRVLVVAETEMGDRIERLWRHEGALTAAAMAQRVRWQLEGWLATGRADGRCRGGVTRVELVPDQLVADDGRQLGFWGGASEVDERAGRAVARLQGMLGFEAVVAPEWRGGRAPGERYRLVPVADPSEQGTLHGAAPTGTAVGRPPGRARDERPWPGALPAPSPAVLWPSTPAVEVVDAEGRRVGVNGRGLLSAPPARCSLGDGWSTIRSWAGPWCVEERWWDPVAGRRRARLQVVLDGGGAHLVCLESGSWWLEASYD